MLTLCLLSNFACFFFSGSADFFFQKQLFRKNVQLYDFTLAANFVLFLPTPTRSAASSFNVQFFQSANKKHADLIVPMPF